MKKEVEQKLEEAGTILSLFGLNNKFNNDICAYTFLALCGIKPHDKWTEARKISMTLTKDIMEFVNEYYASYQPNSRESFRKSALKPLIDINVVQLNPDDPDLHSHSPNTHYAISGLSLKTVQTFGTSDWEDSLKIFKLEQFKDNMPNNILLRKLTIRNFKSIPELSIELGRFNVFIGENGSGKSNILEALAALSASQNNDFNYEGLSSRGVRFVRPDQMLSSFLKDPKKDIIEISVNFDNPDEGPISSQIYPDNVNDIFTKWLDGSRDATVDSLRKEILDIISLTSLADLNVDVILEEMKKKSKIVATEQSKNNSQKLLDDYAIFDLNTKALRGESASESRKTPLGLNGEGLDLLISSFNSYEMDFLDECQVLFKWLTEIISDNSERNKNTGLKTGSNSTLYFKDKYMQRQNNVLSASTGNEGILHVLFYLSLFISNKTPQLLGIDNIETALNPRLCQKLISELVKLSHNRGKQVLITTHNPAILDGLNLHDNEQRLFVVYRSSVGHTRVRRIKSKKDLAESNLKMSEMWMRGSLGGVPDNF